MRKTPQRHNISEDIMPEDEPSSEKKPIKEQAFTPPKPKPQVIKAPIKKP
jgi:hypothetical protein